MIEEKEVLSLTLARSGSKGIPRKNIKNLHGRPLVSYALTEAHKSQYIDRIIVSTDSKQIAKIAKKYGAEVPFMRPKKLATDDAKSVDTIVHAVNWLKENEDYEPDLILLNLGTAPLKTAEDIDNAIETLIEDNRDSLIGLSKVNNHPYWMMKINNNYIEPFSEKYKKNIDKYERRQDLPDVYSLNGAIYIFTPHLILDKKSSYPIWEDTYPYIMSKEKSINIDDMLDWKLAEVLLSER